EAGKIIPQIFNRLKSQAIDKDQLARGLCLLDQVYLGVLKIAGQTFYSLKLINDNYDNTDMLLTCPIRPMVPGYGNCYGAVAGTEKTITFRSISEMEDYYKKLGYIQVDDLLEEAKASGQDLFDFLKAKEEQHLDEKLERYFTDQTTELTEQVNFLEKERRIWRALCEGKKPLHHKHYQTPSKTFKSSSNAIGLLGSQFYENIKDTQEDIKRLYIQQEEIDEARSALQSELAPFIKEICRNVVETQDTNFIFAWTDPTKGIPLHTAQIMRIGGQLCVVSKGGIAPESKYLSIAQISEIYGAEPTHLFKLHEAVSDTYKLLYPQEDI
ncbi:MAG: hypothetical protein AAF621_06380, partial [Pseudomonadota bacterium]